MKPALLIIDVQNEYFSPHGKWVLPDGEQALTHIQAFITAARDAHIPIFHIVHNSLESNAPVFRPGTPGAEIHPGIQVRTEEKTIIKHFPGSFTQTPLEAYLRQRGIDTVIISGFMTQMCCDTTTRQAKERGFSVWFASDATAARDLTLQGKTISHDLIHQITLANMTQFATVMSTEEALQKIAALPAQ